MSSTANSSIQLIIDALADYADQTGIDLSQNQFAERLQQFDTSDAILELLLEREKAFKEYRDENRRLMSCLDPTVRVLHVFSGTIGEALSLVSHASLVPLCISVPIFKTNPTRSLSRQQRLSLSALMFSSVYALRARFQSDFL